MTVAEMEAELARLQAENASLKTSGQNKLTLKVSEKGALMVLGLQRFPVTLYREQWERVFGLVPTMQQFIAAHASELKTKGEE